MTTIRNSVKISAQSARKSVLREIYQKDRILILFSLISGAIAFMASWYASVAVTVSIPSPLGNAGVGVAVSIVIYFIVFFTLSLFRKEFAVKKGDTEKTLVAPRQKFIKCLKTLSMKEVLEQSLRFSMHVALMYIGLVPAIASPAAQLIAGGFGHISVPLFANIRMFMKVKERESLGFDNTP